ncbi:conjugal transfer protein TraH [Devosia sp.]|uniref:conjugal transfer protein TraH n=1 Tax=Devosia sp. TaxID=1871048 RepID=UPI0035B1CBEC
MFDAAFLEQCADPGVKIEIVERFIAAVGTENPLAISITSGNRIILPGLPKTPEEAARLAQRFVGSAVVRAGVTNYPVGVGISDPTEITTDVFDPCTNVRMGTVLFGKVYRIIAHAHGADDGAVLGDALEAWRTGQYEGTYVFAEPDPGPLQPDVGERDDAEVEQPPPIDDPPSPSDTDPLDPNEAGIRVMLPGGMFQKEAH